MSGFIAWQGPSPVTGDPLVLVLTGPSLNTKTGPMYQAWLLLRDTTPFEAIKTGADEAICGACVHRGKAQTKFQSGTENVPKHSAGTRNIRLNDISSSRRTCYVSMFNGPIHIWRKLAEYPVLSVGEAARRLDGEHVRVTAYGDPAFVPYEHWRSLLRFTAGHVGYTHQWRTCDLRFRSMLMASVESEREANEAHRQGWRTFRARAASEPIRADEFQCPASDEGGHRSTCVRCRLCRGTSSPAKSVSILLHGRGAAPRLGQCDKYGALRQDIHTKGHGDLRLTPAERGRVMLALRIFYLRRKAAAVPRSKRISDGLYRFWLDTMREVRQ